MYFFYRHLIGFFFFLSLTIYTAKKVPSVDLHSLQHFPDVLKKADLHKLHAELMTCLPSLPNMPDLHKLREELKTTLPSMDILPSLSGWHVMELLNNCLPERFSSGNYTDVCVLVMLPLHTSMLERYDNLKWLLLILWLILKNWMIVYVCSSGPCHIGFMAVICKQFLSDFSWFIMHFSNVYYWHSIPCVLVFIM